MKLTETEWKVMNVVWESHPVSVRDVFERIEGDTGWVYVTVKTIMDRLVKKGVLETRTRANTKYYDPCIERDDVRNSEVRFLAEKAFDGAFGSMVHFLLEGRKLSKKDVRKLKDYLDTQEEGEDDA